MLKFKYTFIIYDYCSSISCQHDVLADVKASSTWNDTNSFLAFVIIVALNRDSRLKLMLKRKRLSCCLLLAVLLLAVGLGLVATLHSC